MKVTIKILVLLPLILSLHSSGLKTLVDWPSWRDFKKFYISNEGRVVDSSSPNKITTSEGQSYAMFFALVANDHPMFDKLLHWTENNLAAGDLSARLPAWLWGQNPQKEWGVLDKNSATDSDTWIAYDLIEAGRLWNNQHYSSLGIQLLARILKEEVNHVPGLGNIELPGQIGFAHGDNWRLNPSYLPPQLLTRFATLDTNWQDIEQNSLRVLVDSSPKGFAPDWVIWNKNMGWQPDLEHPNIGSYNAIRVYLWIGTLADDLSYKKELVRHFLPMITITQQLGTPPEQINTATGAYSGKGPIGFSAALLPMMEHTPAFTIQSLRLTNTPMTPGEYYNSVLRLFGQGWIERHYSYTPQGELIPEWK